MHNPQAMKRTGIQEFANWTAPRIVSTRLGPVELTEYGHGPAVVSLHGAMGGCDQSRILAQTVAGEGFRHIGLSRPGYLGTPLASGAKPESQADLIAALLDELGEEAASVMAASGGGPAGVFFAHRHPKRCRSLVLLSTIATAGGPKPPLAFKVMQALVRIPFFARRIQKKLGADLDATAARSITDPELLQRTLADPETAPLLKALLRSTSERMACRMDGTNNDIRNNCYEFPLEEIETLVLIAHGTRDPHLPFEMHALNFQRRLRRSELIALEGGEHAAIFTHRDTVRPAVMRFLESTRGRA